MIDYQNFFNLLPEGALTRRKNDIKDSLNERLKNRSFGDLNNWQQAIDNLPKPETLSNIHYQINQNTITVSCSETIDTERLKEILMQLHPWRKGPFSLFETFINTEWRSDWKWQRIVPHISNLKNRIVLDVGCGSGYHAWRMRGAGAQFVLGIDPSPKFLFQFEVFKRYIKDEPVHLLPLTSKDLPAQLQCFDTVFSMGVLYHRKSPFDHLEELKGALKKGGELVLETLVVDGNENTILIPGERYAQMRNVWFIPSTKALEHWLNRLGFENIRTVNIDQTRLEEQRSTDWMTFDSLADFLDPEDISKSIEGHPAPKRAIIIANRA